MYIERLEVEVTSGIFNVPLPPIAPVDTFLSCIRYLKIAISILWLFMIFSINLTKLSITATINDGIFLAKLIFNLIAIGVIKLIVQCLPRLVVRSLLD